MEYMIYISTDFGEIKVFFETDGKLQNEQEVLEVALEKLQESKDIKLSRNFLKGNVLYEITEGVTVE